MPRKCRLPKDDAISILRKYIDHFKTFQFPEYSARVWKDLAKETDGIWSSHCWWVNVTKNRRDILSTVRKQLGIIIEEPVQVEINENESEAEEDERWFDLVLTKERWDSIKPVPTDSNDSKNTNQSLRPKAWTNVIADEFYKQHSLPCAFSFVRNQMSLARTRQAYLKIEGYCRAESCNNRFHGYLDDEPSFKDEKIIIRVQTRDTSRENHEDVKRYVNGDKRTQLGKDCHAEGTSNVLKRLKSENTGRGDVGGPCVPTADVLRHAKYEHVNRELDIKKKAKITRDIVESIFQLQFETDFMGSIHGIGYYPFFTMYGLPEQLSLYLQYCNTMREWSCISIDGTGSLVRKFCHEIGMTHKSGHIFLHCIAIRFAKETVSVFQMLSESQETETFTSWLDIWLGLVKKKPKQCIMDYSRALLNGCCQALNHMVIKDYQNLIFLAIVSGDTSHLRYIETYIRVDVAHLIKMVCRWSATKEIERWDVKDFAIRCVALMVDCQRLQEFKEIFSLTCIVLLHEHEDTTINFNCELITVEDAKKKLVSYMRKRPYNIDDYTKTMHDEDEDDILVFEADDETTSTSYLKIFIIKLVTQAQSVIHEGTKQNPFQALAFYNQLVELANEFILWTAVGMPFFVEHAFSCGSGKNFEDLKGKVLAKYARKIGTEEFLRIHMQHLTGATRSMTSKLISFNAKGSKVPEIKYKNFVESADDLSGIISDLDTWNGSYSSEENNDSELLSNDYNLLFRGHRRGKTTAGVIDQCDQSDDTEAETVPNEVEIEFNDDGIDEGELKWQCKICTNIFGFDTIKNHKCK